MGTRADMGMGSAIHEATSSRRRAHGDSITQTPWARLTTTKGMGTKIQGAIVAAIAMQSQAFVLAPSSLVCGGAGPHARWSTSLDMAYDVRSSPNRWRVDGDHRRREPIEPGFGGIWPGDPDADTHHVTWVNKEGDTVASVDVPVDRFVYFATEDAGVDVPIINKKRMCRNGCCSTCTVKVLDGKVKQEGALGLLKDLKREGYALTCCAYPKSDLVIELQDEDEVYMKQWGNDFESGGVEWGGFLPEDD